MSDDYEPHHHNANNPAHMRKRDRRKFRMNNFPRLRKERRKLFSLMDRLQNYKLLKEGEDSDGEMVAELNRRIRNTKRHIKEQRSSVEEIESNIRAYTLPEDEGDDWTLPPEQEED